MSETPSLAAGTLYVVATPIGNLGDLSPRAQATLQGVNAICAEDTRTTGLLLAHFGIAKAMVALHDHNEDRIATQLVARLQAGETLALVSDAGTPLVSDPGYALVRAARDAGLPVVAIPGPCAVTAALSVAGLPTDEFTFAGFLPARRGERLKRLQQLAREPRTLVLYESPHRIVEACEDLASVFGASRRVCLARELTKRFEQSIRLTADSLPEWLKADENRQRGEFVLVVESEGKPDEAQSLALDPKRILSVLMGELSPSRAARVAAELTGLKRGVLYELAQQIKPNGDSQA